MTPAIFIVDDDSAILDSLEMWFKMKQYKVKTFDNGLSLITDIINDKPDIVLLDVNLNGEDGRYICRDIREKVRYPVKLLLFSANPSSLLMYEDNLADGIINKPFEMKTLEDKCNRLLMNRRR